jgi:hypothetical protein
MNSKSVIQVNNLENASAALAQVQNASANDLAGDQVNLILRIIDATSSLSRYQQELIDAAKYNVESLIESKASDEMLMSTWLFNTYGGFQVIDGFVPLADVTPLDTSNYRPDGMTNLYDTVYLAMTDPHAGIIAYAQSLKDQGIRVKATILVLSDGEDNESRINPREIKALTGTHEGYYFCFMAFGTGFAYTAADAMGFPNVREYNASKSELRKMMGEFSKSQVRASQTTVAPNNFFNN